MIIMGSVRNGTISPHVLEKARRFIATPAHAEPVEASPSPNDLPTPGNTAGHCEGGA